MRSLFRSILLHPHGNYNDLSYLLPLRPPRIYSCYSGYYAHSSSECTVVKVHLPGLAVPAILGNTLGIVLGLRLRPGYTLLDLIRASWSPDLVPMPYQTRSVLIGRRILSRTMGICQCCRCPEHLVPRQQQGQHAALLHLHVLHRVLSMRVSVRRLMRSAESLYRICAGPFHLAVSDCGAGQ